MALFTIMIWGVTFVSTKILITDGLSPVEIFIIRFAIAYLWTLIFSHNRLWAKSIKDECLMLTAGITGGSLYFIVENTALGITFASNVSLIICCAPIFTIILCKIVFRDSIRYHLWIGSVIAFIGVAIVVLNGSKQLGGNPTGDLLSLLAALSWAGYCLILKQLNHSYSNIFITRKVFAYGVLTATIYYIAVPTHNNMALSDIGSIIANLLFLSVGASFLCYLMWNAAVKYLGAERTSNYIYLVPLVTIITSVALLKEPFTLAMAVGTTLIIGGVILSTK